VPGPIPGHAHSFFDDAANYLDFAQSINLSTSEKSEILSVVGRPTVVITTIVIGRSYDERPEKVEQI